MTPVPASHLQRGHDQETQAQGHISRIPTSHLHLSRYLYDNLLANALGINALQSLTHLYLANNKITDMSHLTNMPLLQKLYLQVRGLLWPVL